MSGSRKPDLKARLAELRRDVYALYLACRDPRVAWYIKALAGLVVAYALSPIDLIPDFIPIVGHLDDLLLVPIGIWLVAKLIPPAILAEHRRAADERFASGGLRSALGAIIVIAIWALIVIGVVRLLVRLD